jgi:hypothetical protein
MVFGENSEAANAFRKRRKQATDFSPGGRSFFQPPYERGQHFRSRQ